MILLLIYFSNLDDNTNWTTVIMKRLLRVLHTHVFKIDVDRFTNNILSFINNSKTNIDNYKFEGLYNIIHILYFLFYIVEFSKL